MKTFVLSEHTNVSDISCLLVYIRKLLQFGGKFIQHYKRPIYKRLFTTCFAANTIL